MGQGQHAGPNDNSGVAWALGMCVLIFFCLSSCQIFFWQLTNHLLYIVGSSWRNLMTGKKKKKNGPTYWYLSTINICLYIYALYGNTNVYYIPKCVRDDPDMLTSLVDSRWKLPQLGWWKKDNCHNRGKQTPSGNNMLTYVYIYNMENLEKGLHDHQLQLRGLTTDTTV